jgi:hypothetical protein
MLFLWMALLLHVAGVVSDGIFHSFYGQEEPGIPWSHYVTMLGIVTGFIAAFMNMRSIKTKKARLFLMGTVIGLIIELGGSTWDNMVYHAKGLEPPPTALPHLLVWIGFLTFVVSVIVVSVVRKR